MNVPSIISYRVKGMGKISAIIAMFIFSVASLNACGSSGGNGSLSPHNVEIFVTNAGSNSVTSYRGTDNGNVAPQSIIANKDQPTGLVVDTVNNEIFVTNSGANSINVYAKNANDNTAPIRKISGNATGLLLPSGIALDAVNNEIFVVNNAYWMTYSIDAYSRNANGNVAPIRTISGNATGLVEPYGVAVDTANNEIFVTNWNTDSGSSITVYPRNANGNIAPVRIISGDATAMKGPVAISLATQ